MHYLDFMRGVHAKVKPSLYLEIGCADGRSLSVGACRMIGVDPNYTISAPLQAPVSLYRETSDAFFTRPNVHDILGRPIDLAFIDGMHLAEFALRDFINIERFVHRDSVIVLDDVVPYRLEIASRERREAEWTGDVYKVIAILRKYRPDLRIDVVDIPIKGGAIVRKLDPMNDTLLRNFDLIEREIRSEAFAFGTVEELRTNLRPIDPAAVLGTL